MICGLKADGQKRFAPKKRNRHRKSLELIKYKFQRTVRTKTNLKILMYNTEKSDNGI